MVVILTAIGLVAIALGVARAISPRSYNPQKGEAYECGIPTRGKSWMQFKVGYYLFAILFLMFDVETVFLFAWAVVVQDSFTQVQIWAVSVQIPHVTWYCAGWHLVYSHLL